MPDFTDTSEIVAWIFEKYYPRLKYYVFQSIHDDDAAHDIVLGVFETILRKPDRLASKDEKALRNYLYLNTHNRTIDYARHAKVELRFQQEVQYLGDNVHAPEQWNRERYETEIIAALYEEIKRLSPEYQAVIYLRLAGKSYEQIAAELGIAKAATVRSIAHRARQQLKAMLVARVPDVVELEWL